MTTSRSRKSFSEAARAAFPSACQQFVEEAARELESLVDAGYESSAQEVFVLRQPVQIPDRIHFVNVKLERPLWHAESARAIQCLCTRSTDGYLREAALRRIAGAREHWVIPYVTLLAGDYVVEITKVLVDSIPSLDPHGYASFVRENRPLMRLLRARATSYWAYYYRDTYADRNGYPGLAFLDQLDRWADGPASASR